MQVTGSLKTIKETKTYGAKGFRKREVVVTTEDQFPQLLNIEFIQDKCDTLDNFNEGQRVTISINLKGRQWINPQGESVIFNSIEGWRIEAADGSIPAQETPLSHIPDKTTSNNLPEEEDSDLPF